MFNISITNFKNVIETKTYSFEPGTIIHLIGPSGAGKSTILWAIEWGLFGRLGGVKHRSRRDLIPHVYIETDKINISRNGAELEVTIKSNGGKPQIILTSDAAQGHIYKEFGDRDLWKSCSYLEQRCRNILLEGSGEDKLRILRELVYGYGIGQENDPEYYLLKIQEKIKKTLSDKKNYQAIYDSFYNEMEKETEKYSRINNKWEDSDFNNEEGGDISALKAKIESLTSDFKILSKYHNDQLHVKKSISDLEKRLFKIIDNIDSDNIFDDDKYNIQRTNTLTSISNLTESLKDQELYDKIKEFIPFKINSDLLQDLKIKQSKRKQILTDFSNLGFKVSSQKDIDIIKRDLELQDKAEEFSRLKEIKGTIDNIKENIRQKNKDIDNINININSVNKNINNVKIEIEKINKNIEKENIDIEKKNGISNENIKQGKENIEKMAAYTDKIERSLKKIEYFKVELEKDLAFMLTFNKNELICSQDSLRKSIQGFSNRIALSCPCCEESLYLSGKGKLTVYGDIDINDIKSRLQVIESQLNIINNKESEIKYKESKIKYIESKVKDIEKKIKELKLKNKDLDSKNKELKLNIEEIKVKIKDHESKIDELKLKIEEFKVSIEEFNVNIEEVKINIEELKVKIESIESSSFNKDRYEELLAMKVDKINPSLIKNKDFIFNLIEKYNDNYNPKDKNEIDPLDEKSQIMELENGESLSKLLGQKLKDYLENPNSFDSSVNSKINLKIKELKEYLRELENKKSMWMKACSEKEFLENELDKFNKKIDRYHDEKKLTKIESEITYLRSLEIDWIRYEEMRLKVDKLDEYESDLKNVNSNIEILETLYEKIKKLSIEPVEKIIEVINYKLNEHLDKLFTETPIKVLLSLFRQSTGSKRDSFLKIAVNIQVYHGENNYPNISSLSGGEADRVSLALTLTLAEIFGSPIILLDECMASLDADLRESCLEIIKEMSITVIDVCHESVEGYHDTIISVVD